MSPYGMTKYVTERVIRDLHRARPEWGAVFLRYFNPAGAHLGADIGEEPQGIPNNLMPYIAQERNNILYLEIIINCIVNTL